MKYFSRQRRSLKDAAVFIMPISLIKINMGAYRIINRYYGTEGKLREILVRHSEAVGRKAMECAEAHPELMIDRGFLRDAALLHDIGIFLTDAPGIECHGKLPYICHGIAGARLIREECGALLGEDRAEALARVCERHTGAGLTAADIRVQHLPLPERDYLPETLEEKLICYADKFFSKGSDLDAEKPLDRVRASMSCHGADTGARFEALHALFG